jgi:hypothetical protein
MTFVSSAELLSVAKIKIPKERYRSCPSPPPGAVSIKQQREKYRQKLLAAFDSHYHPDHSVPRYMLPFVPGRPD